MAEVPARQIDGARLDALAPELIVLRLGKRSQGGEVVCEVKRTRDGKYAYAIYVDPLTWGSTVAVEVLHRSEPYAAPSSALYDALAYIEGALRLGRGAAGPSDPKER